MDSRRRKLPVPHVYKADECFSIEDIPQVLPWTPEPQEGSSEDESQEDNSSSEDDTESDEGNADMEASDIEEEDGDSNEDEESGEDEDSSEDEESGKDEESDEEDEESGDSSAINNMRQMSSASIEYSSNCTGNKKYIPSKYVLNM